MHKTLDDAIAAWDNGESVFSIEMGGLGPGYEHAIQVGIFELAKKLRGVALPDDEGPLMEALDAMLSKVIRKDKTGFLNGLSGAQAGAIQNVAYRFVRDGYAETLASVPRDRHIQMNNKLRMIA